MPRYNMRTLRGERVIKKKEGERIKRWESDYKRFVNDARNVLTVEEVTDEIAQTFEKNAIEQEKVSLICPLTKGRIVEPVRYGTCRHLQCFDLKGFLAMKSKRNFLECPICNSKVDSELTGLRVDKFFQKMISNVSGATEIEILGDGTFKVALPQVSLIIPKVIDDEEPHKPSYSTTNFDEVKLETDINADKVQELDSVSSFDIDNESNEIDAEIQNAHFLDTSMTDDITVQEGHSTSAKGSLIIDQLHHKCSYCPYSTNNAGHLLRHIRTHTGEKPFKCASCSYSANEKSDLQTHKRIHNGDKPYKCDQCSYACARSGALKIHMRTHNGDKPYKCGQCSYVCAHSATMKMHMRSHSGDKPYKCNQCSYACARSGTMKIHMRTHNGEKPYKCDQCSYVCAHSGNLKIHMRSHTGEKPHKCGQCSYAFAQADHLSTHMRTHNGDKPYKCNQCSYVCAHSGSLKIHMRTHTGDKPYKCGQCAYASAALSNLNSHMRTHTGDKPYKCDQCSYVCAHSSNLTIHMRNHI